MNVLERYLLVAVGGAIGSCARYGIGGAVASRYGTAFPWGTFAVNVTGSFVTALFLTAALERLALDPRWRLLVAVGFCGGYTTFSTLAYETAELLRGRDLLYAAANVVGSAVAGVAAIYVGSALARWLW